MGSPWRLQTSSRQPGLNSLPAWVLAAAGLTLLVSLPTRVIPIMGACSPLSMSWKWRHINETPRTPRGTGC